MAEEGADRHHHPTLGWSPTTVGDTLTHTMHDVGPAAWFGGGLMGAVGLDGAAAQASDPRERLELASRGWARGSPVDAEATGSHLVGGLGVLSRDVRYEVDR